MFRQVDRGSCSSSCDILIACDVLGAGRIHTDHLLLLAWLGFYWATLSYTYATILRLIIARLLVNTAIIISCIIFSIRLYAVYVILVIYVNMLKRNVR